MGFNLGIFITILGILIAIFCGLYLRFLARKPKTVVLIVFENNSIVPEDYPKGVRIPSIGEYIWFSVFKQGTVKNIENNLEHGYFTTIIKVS